MPARLALGLGLLLVACSGGYPLPPTRCDEWCDATKGGDCFGDYDPAGCVAACEASGKASQCTPELDAVVACYRKHPDTLERQCSSFELATPCASEVSALGMCSSVPRREPPGS